ncbi:peptidase S8 [Bacillus sp. 7586-K]|uniref:S8 family peptidase n=1 Tax=Metabacillus niabensis TaxID=324854 RepID=UPI000BA7B605|nr:peptidase S8 [Bacillus sp. 7586-K]
MGLTSKENSSYEIDHSSSESVKEKKTEENQSDYLTEQLITWGVKVVYPSIETRSDKINKVKVAIIDSGIFKDHADLKGIVKKQYNATSPNEPVIDEYGHGTAVAGIIAAHHNEFGIVGVTQDIDLYDVKVLDDSGKGEPEHLISAIKWCIEQNVDIINISFGYQYDSPAIKEVVERAISSNIIIVAAAGNTYGLGVDYPAKYDKVISVTAINEHYQRLSSSAKGKIDLSAPGLNILSTNNKGSYSLFNGTSFASAFVTGTIAEMLGNLEGKYDLEEIFSLIKKNTNDLGEKGFDTKYGYGLLTIS